MQSLKKERVSILVTDAIKTIIKEENLQPGDKLYSEKELVSKLEVSRSSIREALRMLEVSGVVKVYQGKGVFISDPEEQTYPVKQWVVENADALKEHFEVRLLIEPHAAALACRCAESRDLEALRKAYASFVEKVQAGNVIKAISCDSAFHLAVARATKNRTLAVLMKTMDQTLNEGWYASLHAPGRLFSSIEEHRRLLQAILDRDQESAAKAMEDHLKNALKDIQHYFGTL